MDEFLIEKNTVDDLDYLINFTRWLGDDTIASVSADVMKGTVTTHDIERNAEQLIDNGVTIDPFKAVKLWIAGGTHISSARVRVTIVTAQGRAKSVNLIVHVKS
jgi:hypothetical protein